MPLNDVKFVVPTGGLGRIADGEDHVSAILFSLSPPTSYDGVKIKEYRDLLSAEADGIVEGAVTYGEVWYHVREFFRIQPAGVIWIGFNASYSELFLATAGKVRQVGVFFSNFADISAVHQDGVASLTNLHAPLVVVAGYRGTALTLASVADQASNIAPQVSVLLAGDGAGKGAELATELDLPYIPAVGAVVGALSRAKVHECVAWVEPFNLSDGAELETIRLADGLNDPTNATLNALNTKRYLVLRNHIGISGTYLNDSHTAVAATNDYATLENNRVIQKARRLIRSIMLPQLNSPVTVDPESGKLAVGTVKYFEGLVDRALAQMVSASELSGYAAFVNPDQNVLATSKLTVQVKVVPRGVARNIEVVIGLSVTTEF